MNDELNKTDNLYETKNDNISKDVTEEILRDVAIEENIRKFEGKKIAYIINIIALACASFHLYTSGFGLLETMKQRSIHMAFIISLVFLIYPARKESSKNEPSILDLILSIIGGLASLMIVFFYNDFVFSYGISDTKFQIAFIVLTILLLEATRRCVAKELSIIALIFIIYAFFGSHFPGVLKVSSFSLQRMTDHLYMIPEGIFGTTLGTASNYIILFVIFGSFLEMSGVGILIRDLAIGLVGHFDGGPAKIAIVSSALFGTVSGTAAANVVTTGSFTIPLMKKTGYSSEFSAAVEATASTGGQIVPPIMGTAAFLMADILGISYAVIMVGAILPALLYYISLFISVHLRAKKIGLKGVQKEDNPKVKDVLRERGHLIFPFLIVVALILMRFSPIYAGLYGIIAAIFFSGLRKSTRMSIKQIIEALTEGVKKAVNVSIACACAGFVVGISTLTGIGTILSNYLVEFSDGRLWLLGLLIAVISIILGMGLPATGVYIVVVTVCVPALIEIGIAPLAAHMFPFYYGIYASITPPVCIASYAAAGLANCSPKKAGYTGFKLAIPGLLIPFVFLYYPSLLFVDGTSVINTIIIFSTTLIGILGICCGIEKWFLTNTSKFETILFLGGGILVFNSGFLIKVIGMIIIIFAMMSQRNSYKAQKAV